MPITCCTIADLTGDPHFGEVLAEYIKGAQPDMPVPIPQLETYRAVEQAGLLRALRVDCDSRLVGFAVVLVTMVPHYGALIGSTESLFIMRAYRSMGAGGRLLCAAEGAARSQGAVGLLVSAPTGSSFVAAMERTPQYREVNRLFFKALQ